MGANRELGECSFHVGAGEYIVRLGVREFAQLESVSGRSGLSAVWEWGTKGDHRNWINLVKTALLRHHPDVAGDDLKVADLLDFGERSDNGRVKYPCRDAIVEAMKFTMPEVDPKAQLAVETPPSPTSDERPSKLE